MSNLTTVTPGSSVPTGTKFVFGTLDANGAYVAPPSDPAALIQPVVLLVNGAPVSGISNNPMPVRVTSTAKVTIAGLDGITALQVTTAEIGEPASAVLQSDGQSVRISAQVGYTLQLRVVNDAASASAAYSVTEEILGEARTLAASRVAPGESELSVLEFGAEHITVTADSVNAPITVRWRVYKK